MVLVQETARAQIKIFRVTFGQLLCDGVRHYLFARGNLILYDNVGYCDQAVCTEAEVEEIRGDNPRLPQAFLVDRGLRILRPKDTVYIFKDDRDQILVTAGWSILPDDPVKKHALVKSGYLDLPAYGGRMYRVVNSSGSWATSRPLLEVLAFEDRLTSTYSVPRELIQTLYLRTGELEKLEPCLKWAIEARDVLKKGGYHYHSPIFQSLLRDPFSLELRRGLKIEGDHPWDFRDWEIRTGVWILGLLMDENSKSKDKIPVKV